MIVLRRDSLIEEFIDLPLWLLEGKPVFPELGDKYSNLKFKGAYTARMVAVFIVRPVHSVDQDTSSDKINT